MAQLGVPRYRRMVLAMKPESTYATDVFSGTYVAADIIPCYDISPKAQLDQIENLSMFGELGRLPQIAGMEYATVSFSMRLRGRTAAFDDSPTRLVPESDRPLRGCGLATSFSIANGSAWDRLQYAPTDTHESMTIYVLQEIQGQSTAPCIKLLGALGTVSFSMSAGDVCTARFTFTGKFGGRADVTYVDGSVTTTPQYPTVKSAAFNIAGASAACIGSIDIDLGNVISRVSCVNESTGVAGVFISDRRPTLRIDPQAQLVASKDWITLWRAGTLEAVDFQVGATGSQFNKFGFYMDRCQIIDQGYGQREGLTTFPTEYLATVAAGNDDFSLQWL